MFKSTLAALVALLILSSTALAAPKCSLLVTGSYVRQNLTTQYIDQLTLGIDGTAYWYQSSSFDLLLTAGTYIPEVGSWKCLADGSVLVTTIGTSYFSTIGVDIYKDQNTRFTQKLSVVGIDTLQPTHRIITYIPLANDPLGPGVVDLTSTCTPSVNPCPAFLYKRVKPLTTDITP